MQWPCKLSLLPTDAPYLEGAELLIAGDCAAFAYGNFHEELMNGRLTLICCPAKDGEEIYPKLSEIFRTADIKSVRVARMEVSCCSLLEDAVRRAVADSGRNIPTEIFYISTNGKVLD